MLLPKKEFNIYPKTKSNIEAVLSFYFDQFMLYDKSEGVEFLYSNSILSMNQIEFIARKLSESWNKIFLDFFSDSTTSYKNIMNYGVCGLTLPESKWIYSKGSSARPKIREFIEFVRESENDIDFLALNN